MSDSFDSEDGIARESADSEPFHISRRDWFKTVGIVTAGVGAAAVAKHDKLLPFLNPNPQVVPGVATWYATTCRECPAGCGMLVANREGRAIKCEGNPAHSINAGRLCARGQAALQGLYDPDRIRTPLRRDGRGRFTPASWQEALGEIGAQLAAAGGEGRVAVISDLQTSSLAVLIRQWLGLFGSDQYQMYEPLSYRALDMANGLLLGRGGIPTYRLDHADFILSLGADFLETWLSPVEFARQFATMREVRDGVRGGFAYVGSRLSMTAANADEFVRVAPGEEKLVAMAALSALLRRGRIQAADVARVVAPNVLERAYLALTDRGLQAQVDRVAEALARAKAPLVLAGDPLRTDSAAQATALCGSLMNVLLGSEAVDLDAGHAMEFAAQSNPDFLASLNARGVDVLLIIGCNPAYGLPPGRRFVEVLRQVKTVVHLTPFSDETTQCAHWALPITTPMESWGDYESRRGVVGLQQPVMGALYDTRMPGDALLSLAAAAGHDLTAEFGAKSFHEYLRGQWHKAHERRGGGGLFEPFWQKCLARGGWHREVAPERPKLVAPSELKFPNDLWRELLTPEAGPADRVAAGDPSRVAVVAYPSASLYDGRGANKRWLQELPDPITKVAWASWIEVEPTDAARLGVKRGDMLQLDGEHGSIRAPALIYPGLAPGTVAVPLGQGHAAYGRYAKGIGANAFQLAGSTGVRLTRLPAKDILPCPDGSTSQEGRELARTVILARGAGSEAHSVSVPPATIAGETPAPRGIVGTPAPRDDEFTLPLPESYTPARDVNPPHSYPEHRWAMVIDLARCTGCSACVTACYAENNIGVVGKKTFSQHRDMSWMRIDRYFDWTGEAPDGQAGQGQPSARVIFQPMLCQHCDSAPCEAVCPVFAAAHNDEGLNMQIYNRCVGTRYCSNNCPYKVRRFNWFDYEWPEPLHWQANPEVTMRCRGVMEKCNFCIQRIRFGEWQAKREDRPVRDGEIIPACAQTCPTGAITFGDLMDEGSRVAQLIRHDPRRYQVFPQLNTKPGVVYLKRIVDEG